MNPHALRGRDILQDHIAKAHIEDVIYALTVLKEATAARILDFINDKATKQGDKKISKRTVQTWLKRLTDKNWVINKHNVYSLAPEGRNQKIYGEYYGYFLYNRLMDIPFKGSGTAKLEEYIKRMGVYITYIFMRNSNRAGLDPQYKNAREDYDEWVNDAINSPILLEWFNNVFYSKARQNDYEKLKKGLGKKYGKYIQCLEESETHYYKGTFPFLHSNSISVLQGRKDQRSKL